MNKSNLSMRLLLLIDAIYEKGELTGQDMGCFADCIIASHRLINFNCSKKLADVSLKVLKLLQKLSHEECAIANNTIYFGSVEYALFRHYVFTVNKALSYISESSVLEATTWVANNQHRQGRKNV